MAVQIQGNRNVVVFPPDVANGRLIPRKVG